jgi:hypothetical protein
LLDCGGKTGLTKIQRSIIKESMKNASAVALGHIKSEKKAKAARANGKAKGGRPIGSKDKKPRKRRFRKAPTTSKA